MSALTVRTAGHDDRDAIRTVVREAFGSDDEVGLVEDVWTSPWYLPDLDLVATDDDRIIGHILHSLGTLGPTAAPALAPLAVVPDRQRQGAGTALTLEAIRRADDAGYPFVIVTGHWTYYPRFGFEPAMPLGIQPRDPTVFIDPRAFMVRRLSAFAGQQGTYLYGWERPT